MLPNLELLRFLHILCRRANGARQWKRKISKHAERKKNTFVIALLQSRGVSAIYKRYLVLAQCTYTIHMTEDTFKVDLRSQTHAHAK